MAGFDLDTYFKNRTGGLGADKIQALREASQKKTESLQEYAQQKVSDNAANKGSWLSQSDFTTDSIQGKAINLAASLVSGTARVGGQLASLPANLGAVSDELSLDDGDHQAYNRYLTGKATADDMARLNSKKAMYAANDRPEDKARAQAQADASPDAPTVMQMFNRAQTLREIGQDVTKKFNLEHLVSNERRQGLQKDLEGNFQSNWDQAKQGWESLKKGEDGQGWMDIASGVGKLIYNAGEAAVRNPGAASEYIVENLPQLAVGLVGKAGKVALTSSNVGYGADLYQQGIENYRKANNGQLPSAEERQHMAINAAGAILAEQAGDMLSLGLMKTAGKAGADSLRTGFKESIKNSLKATTEGAVGEAVTEGAQTYMEGEATGKPASAKDIYVGATIGGIAGAGLSGGGRAVAELAGATPEKAAKRAEDQAATETFIEHAKTNNADFYLDEKSKDYNPAKGVAVLFSNSQAADTTPEAKQQNVERAHDIIAGLESKRQDLQNQLDQMTPEGIQARIDGYKARLDTAPPELASRIQGTVDMLQEELTNFDPKSVDQKAVKSLTAQLGSLDRQIGESTKLRDELEVFNSPKEADIEAAVETADKAVDVSTPESDDAAKGAVAHVVSLAMNHPDSFSDDHLNRLVSNQSNGLSAQQRTYLRSVSESRIAENAMKTLGIVENEVMKGDPSKNQLGIADYKQRMAAAIKSRDEEKAATALHMLGKFADAHQQKLDTFLPLFNKAGKRGSFNVVPTKQGWQLADTQDVSLAGQQANRKLGGLTISAKTSKLIGKLQAESAALNASRAQLKAVYDLRFTPQKQQQASVPPVAQTAVNQVSSTEGVNSVNPSKAQAAPEQTAVEPVVSESNTASNQSTVDSIVDSQAASTEAKTEEAEAPVSRESGKLSVFKEVAETAGKKFSEVFKSINLVAHNLVQKPGKEGGTQRPLVAAKDFLSGWLDGSIDGKALATFIGAGPIGVQQTFLDHFKATAKQWLPVITKNLVQGQVVAGKEYKKAIKEANQIRDPKARKVELARIEKEFEGKKPGQVTFNPELQYTNPIQYLISLDENGKANTEENIKTAIAAAAFMYVAENAKAPQMSSPESVKAMFGLGEYDIIGDKLLNTVIPLGSPEKTVIISMGQRAVQALGLAAKKEATQDFLARLEADLGAHVMKLLVDQGVMQRTVVPRTVISDGLKHLEKHDASKQGSMAFLRMVRSPGKKLKDRKLNPVAEAISAKAVGTKGILGKLFGVEAQVKEPSWEPIKVSQTTTANTDQAVPDELKKVVAHENSVANYVREDVWTLLQGLGEEAFLEMAGYTEIDESTMHKFSIQSAEVSNEALIRELSAAVSYFSSLENSVEEGGSTLKLKQPLYLAHSIWKQQRVGIDGVINPQSSKIHRWMLTREDWKTEVSSSDLDSFMLRVAEGLGVKTDKQDNSRSLTTAKDLFNTESKDPNTQKRAVILQAAVDALIASRQPGAEMSAAQQQAIVAGVKAGGEKMHSMDALIAMANYQEAKANSEGKSFTFEVQMMGEVDGVTNGPMLSHLSLGAASDASALLNRLNKGGFFQEGSGFTNYNVWRGTGTNTDLYESTISAVIANITKQTDKMAAFGRIEKITGTLYNERTQKVEKAGRNIIKKPLTAMLFGSSVKGAVASMFREFIDTSYAGFEKIAKMKEEKAGDRQKDLNAYVDNLNALLKEAETLTEPVPYNSVEEFLVNFEFSDSQEKALEEVFNRNLGEAVKKTMKDEFSAFLAIRDTINTTANATFSLYDAAYQGIRQNVIKELIASGDIKAGSKTVNGKLKENAGDALHDLTADQEKLIEDRIAKLNPEVLTYMAKLSKNSEGAGLHISKSSRKLSQEGMYQNTSRFGTALPDTVDENGNTTAGGFQLANAAYQRIREMPGVAMVPMMVHSLDSAISHLALMGRQVLNVHDAHGTGLKGFIETAHALNKATWKAVLHYSPAAEMRDSFKNTLMGMDTLLQSKENTEAVIQELRNRLTKMANDQAEWIDGEKVPMPLHQVLTAVASDMYNTAYKSDKTKYETMAQLQYVDQYALEGGQYEVTDADRAEAQALLDGMGKNTVPRSVWNAIDRINEVVLGVKTDTANSPYGELGKSSIASDMDLVHVFEDQPLQKSGDIAKLIMDKLSPANRVVLRKAMKLVGPDFPIQMLSSRTQDGAMGKQFNARGWFAYNGEKEAVYVLSPEFKASGLTPDLLVHELLHAALAKTINHPNTKEAKELVKSLESLVGKVQAHLDANPELKAKYGFKLDVHELVSWGMSDAGFQQDVLTQVPMTKATVANKAMSAMMAFIKAVSKFIGLPMTVKNAEGQVVDNGLASLIQDVAGLFEQAQNPENGKATEAQSFAMEAIQNLSTVEVYEALDDQTISPTFDEHLRGLLSGIVTKLHGPFGTFKALVESKQASTPKELWDQAKGKGAAPFGSAALAASIPMNDQVAFVLEQVEASVHGALSANTGAAHDVYVELNKLYQEARTKLENSTTLSPALRDFLFKMESGAGNRSRHLARFAALGLAHPEVNAALKMGTDRSPLATSGSFAHRLESLFQKVLEWFNGKLTHTFAGQAADEKLNALVKQLVEIEAKRKEPMLQKASVLDFVENSMKQGAANLKGKVEKASQSKWVRDRKNSIVRTAGAVVSTVAGDRVEAVMNHIQEVRDRQMNKGFGLAMGMVNEIRGMNDGNKMFHRLIREAKLREGIREDLITHTGNVSLESFANQGKDLTQEDKHAITAGLLRTDISALLAHHSMDEVAALLSSPAALSQEIKRLEGQLAPYRKARGFYERYAKNLAYKMVKGQVKGHHLLMNASNIAHLFGTGNESYVTTADAAATTPIIDQLVSLYAFQYTKDKHKNALSKLLASEGARTDGNGVEMVLKLHKSLQEQSKERLFEGSEALMMKGYVPEIYDPKKEVVVATEKEGVKLEAQGYIKGNRVSADPLDPDKSTERFVYKRDGGGLRPWLSAIFSYTGETAKGSRSKTDNVQNLNEWKANKQDIRRMTANKRAAIQREFRYDPNYDPSKVEENYAAPILNPQGEVTDYRYLMQEENKDDLLKRDNRFDKVLGFFAGNIYDKESTKESNRKAVEALREQYLADFATRSVSYRKVGPDSEDMELQDIYRMLPEDTKQAIKEIWGTEYMMVRSDLMDINFGYRKTSVTDAFHKERKNAVDAWFVGLMTHVMGEKAEYNLRRAEDIWQEIVAEAKEILVIKNLSTLLGNIGSNISLLYWHGVPIKDMARYHRIALKGVSNYRQDSAALIELETQLAAGYIKNSRQEMEREIIRLKDALEHNPVKELIDAGLMPSIVEDVSPDDDMYSYKSRLVHYVDDHSSKLNKHVLGAAKTVYMAKDTQMYKALRHATQLSDFVARYALYAHKMSRKDNSMSKDEALQLASDSFVNYDLPSHRKLQYMNDMGFVMFTKYYLRIQKVIAHLYAENPGRALALLVTDHFFSSAPMLTDSGFTHKLGNNPFSLGALEYPGVLDELATIKLVK